MKDINLPIVDLDGIDVENADAAKFAASEISRACRDVGFFVVVNHDVPVNLIQQSLRAAQDLFSLPDQEKFAMDIKNSKYMRGYFAYGADKSDGVHGDVKEGFDIASEVSPDDSYVVAGIPFYGPNVWPTQIPNFQNTITKYHAHMLNLGLRLLRLFSIGLGMRPDYFDDKFKKPIAQLRILKYPPGIGTTGKHIGAGEHTDFGWITMIAQDDTGGLEVQDRHGEWRLARPLEGAFVVNVGDLMARWANELYSATMHRVINRSDRDRYSLAFFMDPDYFTVVSCLPTCRSPGKEPKFPAITVGDYMNQRFYDTTDFRSAATRPADPLIHPAP